MNKGITIKLSKKQKKESVLTINTIDLRQGMRFDAPVYFNDKSLFVAKRLPIKNKDIFKLKKWGISKV